MSKNLKVKLATIPFDATDNNKKFIEGMMKQLPGWAGLELIDSKEDLLITILPCDWKVSNPKDPTSCLIANAGIREYGAQHAVVLKGKAYIDLPHPNNPTARAVTRLMVSPKARATLDFYDTTEGKIPVDPKPILLHRPCESQKIGAVRSYVKIAKEKKKKEKVAFEEAKTKVEEAKLVLTTKPTRTAEKKLRNAEKVFKSISERHEEKREKNAAKARTRAQRAQMLTIPRIGSGYWTPSKKKKAA